MFELDYTGRKQRETNELLSKTKRKKISRYAILDSKEMNYVVSAFLVAQLGKNYDVNEGKDINGIENPGVAAPGFSLCQPVWMVNFFCLLALYHMYLCVSIYQITFLMYNDRESCIYIFI